MRKLQRNGIQTRRAPLYVNKFPLQIPHHTNWDCGLLTQHLLLITIHDSNLTISDFRLKKRRDIEGIFQAVLNPAVATHPEN